MESCVVRCPMTKQPRSLMSSTLVSLRCFLNFVDTSLSLVGNLGCFALARLQQPQEQCYPFPAGVCSIFLCTDNGMAARVWELTSLFVAGVSRVAVSLASGWS